MRRLALGVLLLALFAGVAHVIMPVAGADPAAAAPVPVDSAEKRAAGALRDQLKQCETNHNNGIATSDADWDALDAKIAAYQTEYGVTDKTTHNLIWLRKTEIDVARKVGDMPRYYALLQRLATDPHAEVATFAKTWIGLTMQPLDLKYTAVDGTQVDLASMRGKVVLIDFWATWCGPCREEVPNVVAAYRKYHDQGFEIVGVSLDQDKDALVNFTRENGMVWPQYFDGKMWRNDISQRFEINLIPGMWLVGKDGIVITTRAREDLDGNIEKALAAP